MKRRPTLGFDSPSDSQQETQALLSQVTRLLEEFQALSADSDLRKRVRAVIPVHHAVLELGKSLLPKELASSAQQRLLHYFRQYPKTILPREELEVVAGIDQWARRVRELRVEQGWAIASGKTIRQMAEQGEFPITPSELAGIQPDDYALLRETQDWEAAHRWNMAKGIRQKKTSVRDKILEYLRSNVGTAISGEELQYVAGNRTEWARRVRELRTEYGWPILTKQSGGQELDVGMYLLEEDRQSPEHDRVIPDRVRRSVLERDHYACRRCGWNHDLYSRSDPRHLELHHIEHHAHGGLNTIDNLATLCTGCHDELHAQESSMARDEFLIWLSGE